MLKMFFKFISILLFSSKASTILAFPFLTARCKGASFQKLIQNFIKKGNHLNAINKNLFKISLKKYVECYSKIINQNFIKENLFEILFEKSELEIALEKQKIKISLKRL